MASRRDKGNALDQHSWADNAPQANPSRSAHIVRESRFPRCAGSHVRHTFDLGAGPRSVSPIGHWQFRASSHLFRRRPKSTRASRRIIPAPSAAT